MCSNLNNFNYKPHTESRQQHLAFYIHVYGLPFPFGSCHDRSDWSPHGVHSFLTWTTVRCLPLVAHLWHQQIEIVIFSALHFHAPDLAALLTEGLLGVVFRQLHAHRWKIYVFTTQDLAAVLFTTYHLVLGGALLLAAQKTLMLLCKKRVAHSGFLVGIWMLWIVKR